MGGPYPVLRRGRKASSKRKRDASLPREPQIEDEYHEYGEWNGFEDALPEPAPKPAPRPPTSTKTLSLPLRPSTKRLKKEVVNTVGAVEQVVVAEKGDQGVRSGGKKSKIQKREEAGRSRFSTRAQDEEDLVEGEAIPYDTTDTEDSDDNSSDSQGTIIAPSVAPSFAPSLRGLIYSAEAQARQADIDAISHFWGSYPPMAFLKLLREELQPRRPKTESKLIFENWGKAVSAELARLARHVDVEEANAYIEAAYAERTGGQRWIGTGDVQLALRKARKEGKRERMIKLEHGVTYFGDERPEKKKENGEKDWEPGLRTALAGLARFVDREEVDRLIHEAFDAQTTGRDWLIAADVGNAIDGI
ncbi:hypothetical protein M409DRAFT_55743 [Zasmidium cellare ATCC 36951]|uniref:Uncharacterized protein n=1 Tax=Zasmidium cellare ATCC 36951 TaxID=1080233 RepID=A0A6A6CI09_ZASCE|nr:uncharacterized protein M409DRAFT_55743 [Zasmidium cellare ATCC 36951]KAF2165329.1 hypothetical protein M409DRAFT_55743 [Zasmidium cellare ATCC 36951]